MQTRSLKILIVEDNPTDLSILRQHILVSGMAVTGLTHAASLADALQIFKNDKPDVIILDLFLPDSESLNTFTAVNDAEPAIPIIIHSSAADVDSAIQAIKMGAQDYLFKGEFDAGCLAKSIFYSVERKRNQETLESKIHDAVICSQETEKEELGKELHDNVNQILASCKLYLEVSIQDKKKRDALLPKSFEYLNLAIHEIRKLSKSLVAPSFDHVNLGEALIDLLECAETDTITNYKLEDEFQNAVELPGQFQLAVYRIAQEQLQNISKHAKAKKVIVQLYKKDQNLILSIVDDGIGFNAEIKSKGIGLRNIRSRVESQKGEIKIISSPQHGCTLLVSMPLKTKNIKSVAKESLIV